MLQSIVAKSWIWLSNQTELIPKFNYKINKTIVSVVIDMQLYQFILWYSEIYFSNTILYFYIAWKLWKQIWLFTMHFPKYLYVETDAITGLLRKPKRVSSFHSYCIACLLQLKLKNIPKQNVSHCYIHFPLKKNIY